jgi:membrane AbrB-like protein
MLVSATGHAAGLAHGAAPDWLIFCAFAVTGAVLGTRMTRVDGPTVRRHAAAGLSLVAAAMLVSLAFAWFAATLTGLPFGQVWVAFAPGGVEAMAAIGLALGYDPAFVAVHHVARIFALVLIVPAFLRLLDRPGD